MTVDHFSVHVDRLNSIVDRITGTTPPPLLWIEQESVKHYTVTDLSTSQVMWRGPDLNQAESWARTFAEREGGSVDESSVAIVRGVAANRAALREAFENLLGRERFGGRAAARRETPALATDNVVPIRRASA